jgi:RHS repeat-associated protein
LPFGELLEQSGTFRTAKGYTNHEQTDASGLIYMQARFYLPQFGRFTAPDPARDQHFEDTQSWNIYSYVRNSPIMSTDPTGMEEKNEKTVKPYQAGPNDRPLIDDTTVLQKAKPPESTSCNEAGPKAKAGVIPPQPKFDKQKFLDTGEHAKSPHSPRPQTNGWDVAGQVGATTSITLSVLENGAKGGSTVAKVGKLGGVAMLPVGTAIDIANPDTTAEHATRNFTIGVGALLLGGVPGAIVGGGYAILDNFVFTHGWPSSDSTQQQIEDRNFQTYGFKHGSGSGF